MKKYRKKPIVIDAVRFDPSDCAIDLLERCQRERDEARETIAATLRAWQTAQEKIIDLTKERDEARGQRDRLAAAIRDAIDCRMIPITSANEGGAAKYSIQVRTADKLREAMQALTPNELSNQ